MAIPINSKSQDNTYYKAPGYIKDAPRGAEQPASSFGKTVDKTSYAYKANPPASRQHQTTNPSRTVVEVEPERSSPVQEKPAPLPETTYMYTSPFQLGIPCSLEAHLQKIKKSADTSVQAPQPLVEPERSSPVQEKPAPSPETTYMYTSPFQLGISWSLEAYLQKIKKSADTSVQAPQPLVEPERSSPVQEKPAPSPETTYMYTSPFQLGISWGPEAYLQKADTSVEAPQFLETSVQNSKPESTIDLPERIYEYRYLKLSQEKLAALHDAKLDSASNEENLDAINALLCEAYSQFEQQKRSENYKQELLKLHLEIGHLMLHRDQLNEASSHFMVLAGYIREKDQNRWEIPSRHCYQLSGYSKNPKVSDKHKRPSEYYDRGFAGLAISNAWHLKTLFKNNNPTNRVTRANRDKFSTRLNNVLTSIREQQLSFKDTKDQHFYEEAKSIAEQYINEATKDRKTTRESRRKKPGK
ncbi:hypothetical protein [Endozoicomonas numazuensis]|uniref:Uncharacterized protein n=1 Tax=Endozoicomonas numazuensis TaxID=1137799 RepID=A0A081NER5_9GAMM|nr:hypothetical protein [Endozoicomonas numazuensis]KEQ16938.1 hypothetical protein GZ78_20090 [Endozoicomonas numazuensis]